MARYIDVDKLARKIRYIFKTYGVSKVITEKVNKALNDSTADFSSKGMYLGDDAEKMECFKHKVDFVEVVRCEKCSYYDNGECNNSVWNNGEYEIQVFKTSYCSYGERRDT